MFLHKTTNFTIYFGDNQESISLDEIDAQQKTQSLRNIADQLHINQMVFLHQEHGIQGLHVKFDDDTSQFFQQPGDYLFTQKKECGIGIVTGDCLPIVIYDQISHAAGIVHAGWKGLAAGILQVAVQKIIEKLHVSASTLEMYVGPAARPCCYEVQQDFIERFKGYENNPMIFKRSAGVLTQEGIEKNAKIYFDSRAFIIDIARSLGIDEEKIYTRYNVCTICDLSFCSYRRQKERARRQISMICLH